MTKYNYEVGYESLLEDFKQAQKKLPKGVRLKRNKGTINLEFELAGKTTKKGCNCAFTIDGIDEVLVKARKVANALKEIVSKVEFEQWYDKEILENSRIIDDVLTFGEAIAKVEQDFWDRPDRRRRKRDKNNPSDCDSYKETYGRFYNKLPSNAKLSADIILKVIEQQGKGKKSYKHIISAMKKLCRTNKREDILQMLNDISITQTEFRSLPKIWV